MLSIVESLLKIILVIGYEIFFVIEIIFIEIVNEIVF